MKFLICIDDTDDLTKDTSTGLIATLIGRTLCNNRDMKMIKGVTRHQLLLMEGVPYTSHNSAMCIEVEGEGKLEELAKWCIDIVKENMAETSNPGICLCAIDNIEDINPLISFGRRAQREIIEKDQVRRLKEELPNIIAEEIGGNGQGIIGAIAGVGLRLSGNDGTFRGKVKFPSYMQNIKIQEAKQRFNIDQVIDIEKNRELSDSCMLLNGDYGKLLFRDYKKVAYAAKVSEGMYSLLGREWAMDLDSNLGCSEFAMDNDLNECITEDRVCKNCLYRRFTEEGMVCSLKMKN